MQQSNAKHHRTSILLWLVILVMAVMALAQAMNVYRSLSDAALYFGIALSTFSMGAIGLVTTCVCLGWFFMYFSGTHQAIVGPKNGDSQEKKSTSMMLEWPWYLRWMVQFVAYCNVFANACVVCGGGILGLPLLLHNLAISGMCYQFLYVFFALSFFLSGFLSALCTTFGCIVKAAEKILDALWQKQCSLWGCLAAFSAVVTAIGSAIIAYHSTFSMVPDVIHILAYVVVIPTSFHMILAYAVAVLTFIAAASLYGNFIFEYISALGGSKKASLPQKAHLHWYGYILPVIATAGQLIVVAHSAVNAVPFYAIFGWGWIGVWFCILALTYGCSFTNQFQKSMRSVITHMPSGKLLGGCFGAAVVKKSMRAEAGAAASMGSGEGSGETNGQASKENDQVRRSHSDSFITRAKDGVIAEMKDKGDSTGTGHPQDDSIEHKKQLEKSGTNANMTTLTKLQPKAIDRVTPRQSGDGIIGDPSFERKQLDGRMYCPKGIGS